LTGKRSLKRQKIKDVTKVKKRQENQKNQFIKRRSKKKDKKRKRKCEMQISKLLFRKASEGFRRAALFFLHQSYQLYINIFLPDPLAQNCIIFPFINGMITSIKYSLVYESYYLKVTRSTDAEQISTTNLLIIENLATLNYESHQNEHLVTSDCVSHSRQNDQPQI